MLHLTTFQIVLWILALICFVFYIGVSIVAKKKQKDIANEIQNNVLDSSGLTLDDLQNFLDKKGE